MERIPPIVLEVLKALQKDDLPFLQTCFEYEITATSRFHSYSSFPEHLRDGPPLVSVAAYYSSEQCFNFLYANGTTKPPVDARSRNLMYFAFLGGNRRIISTVRLALTPQSDDYAALCYSHDLVSFAQLSHSRSVSSHVIEAAFKTAFVDFFRYQKGISPPHPDDFRPEHIPIVKKFSHKHQFIANVVATNFSNFKNIITAVPSLVASMYEYAVTPEKALFLDEVDPDYFPNLVAHDWVFTCKILYTELFKRHQTYRSPEFETLPMLAIKYNGAEALADMIKEHFDLEAVDMNGNTTLSLVIRQKMLRQKFVDNCETSIFSSFTASGKEISHLELLLEYQAEAILYYDPLLTDEDENNLLHYTAKLNNGLAISLLLPTIDPYMANKKGETPIDLVNASLRYLFDPALPCFRNFDDLAGIHRAAQFNQPSLIAESIVNLQDSLGRTPLMIALACRSISFVNTLLTFKPDMKIADNRGFPAFAYALLTDYPDKQFYRIATGLTRLDTQLLPNSLPVLFALPLYRLYNAYPRLCEANIYWGSTGPRGRNILHVAAKLDDLKLVLMFRHKINPMNADADGKRPADLTTNQEIIKSLTNPYYNKFDGKYSYYYTPKSV